MNKYIVVKILAFICFLSLFVFQAPVLASGNDNLIKINISKLKKTKACPGCDLKGAVLDRMDLTGANLEGANLSDAKLFLANLAGANLKNAYLKRAIFGGADLAGADLRGADLNGADLTTAYLVGAKFDGEFIKTKPYKEEGLPEIEKKTYVDDTVRPKKVEEGPAADQFAKPAPQSLSDEKKKVPVVATRTYKKPKETFEGVVEKKTSQKPSEENAVLENQGETDGPLVKTVKPIKKVTIEKKIPSLKKVEDTGDVKEKQNVVELEDHKKQNGNFMTAENDSADREGMTKPEEGAASVKPSSSISANPGEKEQGADSTASEKGENQKISSKESGESSAMKKTSEHSEKIIEKNLLSEKKISIKQDKKPSDSQSKEMASDKTRNLKMLLDTNKCYHCDLSGLDLSGKDLGDADLEGADFTGSNLEKTDLDDAVLKGAIFVNANLKNANLADADLYKADFSGADLTGADLEGAKTDGTNFSGTTGMHK